MTCEHGVPTFGFCKECCRAMNAEIESSRSPGCYFVDLEDMKRRIVGRIKLMEPGDGEEWHNDLYAVREEALLAVLAAGVPTNCIALEDPKIKTVSFHIQTLGLGFRFTRST